jgi:hypothetical protein
MAPVNTSASIHQQKAIRSWALSTAAVVLFITSGLMGLAAPAVPWFTYQYSTSSGYSTVVISLVAARLQVCPTGAGCTDVPITLPPELSAPALLPGAVVMFLGALFLLVGGLISFFIARHLRGLSQHGNPSNSPPCCHSPAAQGFAWTGFALYLIGASDAGSAYLAATEKYRTETLKLGAAPGGVMAAFVVVAALAGCVLVAVVNCQILGVTGVGQSTSNCCCRQEAGRDEWESVVPATGAANVMVVMTSPLGGGASTTVAVSQ